LIQKLSKAGILESGGGFNPFTSEIVNSVIRSGILTTHINRLKDVYRRRIEVFVEQSTKSFPEQVVFQYPSGGYFIWVELPDHIDTKLLRQAAKTDNVDFLPGSFFSSKNRLKNYIRLSFAFYPKEILREGIKRLGNILLKHLS
ncbi:MAG: hypothetical protein KAJ25_13595, partial [Desulfobacula sp.]|nr:hypothetical protein [Desulfobacula sp.]